VHWNADGTTVSLGGILPGDDSSQASWINNRGAMVGNSYRAGKGYDGPFHAIKWTRSGTAVPLNPLPGDTGSAVYGINDAGVAVGFSYTPGGVFHAVRWSPGGQVTDIGAAVSGPSEAYLLNNEGVTVGYLTTDQGVVRAARWSG
jgi:probable HAF family extracellular repeat protein